MEDLIEYIGFDALHSFEDSSNPVTAYKKQYGHRIALMGGVDIDKLTRLEEGELRSYVQQFLEHGQAVLPDQIRPEFLQFHLLLQHEWEELFGNRLRLSNIGLRLHVSHHDRQDVLH